MPSCIAFSIEVSDRLDLEFCVSSGQVFRWQQLEDDSWLGIDGNTWFRVRQSEVSLSIESNEGPETFRRLFRLDWDAVDVERDVLVRAPELQPYMSSLKGLRLMRPSDPVETFFSFLCTPNNNIKRITQMGRSSFFCPVCQK